MQARVRTRVLSTFVRRALIDKDDAAEMRAWAHDGGAEDILILAAPGQRPGYSATAAPLTRMPPAAGTLTRNSLGRPMASPWRISSSPGTGISPAARR